MKFDVKHGNKRALNSPLCWEHNGAGKYWLEFFEAEPTVCVGVCRCEIVWNGEEGDKGTGGSSDGGSRSAQMGHQGDLQRFSKQIVLYISRDT